MADFSKNVVRQLKIRFIGNCTYDKDIKAACDYLGFNKDREDELKNLAEDHHFFVATTGSAVTIDGQRPKQVLKVKFYKNKTKLYDFDFGKSFKITEKDAGTIRDIAADFSDIPQEIDQELSEKEILKKENIDLKKKTNELTVRINQLERQPQIQKMDPQAMQKAEQIGYQKAWKESTKQLEQIKIDATRYIRELQAIIDLSKTNIDAVYTRLHTLPKLPIPQFDLELPKETKLPIAQGTTNYYAKKPIEAGQPIPLKNASEYISLTKPLDQNKSYIEDDRRVCVECFAT